MKTTSLRESRGEELTERLARFQTVDVSRLSWLSSILGSIDLWGSSVRVKVEIEGPLGLDLPLAKFDYTITVRNKSTHPITVEQAGVIVFAAGGGRIEGDPIDDRVRLEGRESARWKVRTADVRQLLVNKGAYQGTIVGFAKLATGREVMSGMMYIDRPKALPD